MAAGGSKNVTTVLDCIDYERAEYKTFSASNKIMLFEKYAFMPEKIGAHSIFKIVDEPRRAPFVSEAFVQNVVRNNLTGVKFELVWDSEADESKS